MKISSNFSKFWRPETLNRILPARLRPLASDYYQSFKSAAQLAYEKPVKAFVIGSSIPLIFKLNGLVPSPRDFKDELIKAHNSLIILSPSNRNKKSEAFIKDLCHSLDLQQLKIVNFCFFFNIILKSDNSEDLCLYGTNLNTKYATLGWSEYIKAQWEKIVDVSILNRWLILEKHVKNCDVT